MTRRFAQILVHPRKQHPAGQAAAIRSGERARYSGQVQADSTMLAPLTAAPASPSPAEVRIAPNTALALQRSMGNREATRLLQRRSSGEVSVVDDRDSTGWLASAFRVGEIYMRDVASMVSSVLTAAGSRPITRLNVLDHGNADGMEFGDDWIDSSSISSFSGDLGRLSGKFSSGGFVHLQGCDVGQNTSLIVAFARIFGVPVYAGTGGHNPIYRFNWGDYVRGKPDGTVDTNVSRP